MSFNRERKLPRHFLVLALLYYLGPMDKDELVNKCLELCRDVTIHSLVDCGLTLPTLFDYAIIDLAMRRLVEYRLEIDAGGIETRVELSEEGRRKIDTILTALRTRMPLLVEKIEQHLGKRMPKPVEVTAESERRIVEEKEKMRKISLKKRLRKRLRDMLRRLEL